MRDSARMQRDLPNCLRSSESVAPLNDIVAGRLTQAKIQRSPVSTAPAASQNSGKGGGFRGQA